MGHGRSGQGHLAAGAQGLVQRFTAWGFLNVECPCGFDGLIGRAVRGDAGCAQGQVTLCHGLASA